ncbi:hypothetical protein SDC9_157310 [bioreactor metagenome]|uniref:DUF58 domain-containing protein n=1 Tax=bioreactor metagenome TaxID=1076179 RepID=A0A645F737_9ZZZZ
MPELHPVPPATLAPSAEQLLQRLEWRVLRRLDGLLQGDYRTLMRGAGLDLSDLREYQPHDDVRHIDWNVTARLGTPHVRVFTEDREMTAWFLLDLSPSVDFGPPGRTKRDQLTSFAGVLARLFTRRGNRVGAVLACWRACSLGAAIAWVRCCMAPASATASCPRAVAATMCCNCCICWRAITLTSHLLQKPRPRKVPPSCTACCGLHRPCCGAAPRCFWCLTS